MSNTIQQITQEIQDRIQEIAYLMWESAGRQQGMAMEYWLAAEQEVLSTMQAAAARMMPREPAPAPAATPAAPPAAEAAPAPQPPVAPPAEAEPVPAPLASADPEPAPVEPAPPPQPAGAKPAARKPATRSKTKA
jgi:hypothetical protein